MRNISNIVDRFIAYIRDLDRIGKLVTLVGLLPAIIDIGALILGRSIPIDPLIAFVVFVFAIIYANFRLYEILKKPDLEVVVTDYSCNFSNAVDHNLIANTVNISDGFHLDISGHFNIHVNDSGLSDAYFYIHSIDTNWEIVLEEIKKSEVKIEVPKPDYELENPIILNNRNTIPKCRFSVVMPIRILSNGENKFFPFRIVGSLSEFAVTIGVDLKGGKTVFLPPISPDIVSFHESVENQLIQLTILQSRQGKQVVPNTIFALRDLWQETLIK